jgi:transcriptional regulator with XRE-family HTH domain
MTYAIFGEFLKSKRESAGLSQGDVAKKLKYGSPQFISNWERGVAKPPVKTLGKIISLYKIDREELIEGYLKNTKHTLETALATKFKKTFRS